MWITAPVDPWGTFDQAPSVRIILPTLLVNDFGRTWRFDTLSAEFRKTCELAGLEPLGLHVLRHTFASRFVMAGVDLRTVQELMGHGDIQITLRYARLSSDHKRAATHYWPAPKDDRVLTDAANQ